MNDEIVCYDADGAVWVRTGNDEYRCISDPDDLPETRLQIGTQRLTQAGLYDNYGPITAVPVWTGAA